MIYIIYECDKYRLYHSYCIKGMFTNKKDALKAYKKIKPGYKNDEEGWILNLSYYNSNELNIHSGSNAIKEFNLIKSTEEK